MCLFQPNFGFTFEKQISGSGVSFGFHFYKCIKYRDPCRPPSPPVCAFLSMPAELCHREWGGLWERWRDCGNVALPPPFVSRRIRHFTVSKGGGGLQRALCQHSLSLQVSPLLANVWPLALGWREKVVQGRNISCTRKEQTQSLPL